MTYTTNLQETQMLSMPELYVVSYGTTIERFTNYTSNVIFQGYEYLALPIKRSSITQDNEFKAQTFNINLVPTDLFKQYVSSTPIEPVRITLYRALSSDLTSYVTIFSGVVKSLQFSNGQCVVVCISDNQFLRKKVPCYIYQAFCNHTLFDSNCALNSASYKTNVLLTYVSGTTIKAAEFATKANGYFNQGYLDLGSGLDKRLILSHTSDTVIIHCAFDNRVVNGITMYAYPGCDKSPATCVAKFNNLTNMLAFPYIPSKNPITTGYM